MTKSQPFKVDTRWQSIADESEREESLLDAIGDWHAADGAGCDLHEYLGMTWQQYARWAETGMLP